MSSRLSLRTSIAGLVLLVGCSPAPDYTGASLYSGFTLVDPVAESHTENAWLVVADGLILEMGAGKPPAADFGEIHDVSGLHGMAGLIDAHAHVTAGPFESGVQDGAPWVGIASGGDYSRFNGAVALAFGVTSVRNPGGSTEANAEYDRMIGDGTWVGPEARHAGSVVQPPPFGGRSFAYPTTPEAWDGEAARQADAGMTYFKLYTDLTEAELAEGVRAARAHGLVPIAHLNAVSWTRAVELGVEQLEHALPTSPALLDESVRDDYTAVDPTGRYMFRWFELADLAGPAVDDMIGTLVERGTVVNLTLMVQDITFHADDLSGSGIFPDVETAFYHPEGFASAMANYDAIAGLWTEDDFARARAVWPRVLDFAARLHRAGVPLMIGTDGTGGAPVYARELSHHVAAGIPAWEVLRMATAGNAELMGWGASTGRLEVGMEADMVFLRADPVADVRNVREVAWVVTDGRPHRADDLREVARGVVEGR